MSGRGQQGLAALGIASILGVPALVALENTTGFASEFIDSIRTIGSSASGDATTDATVPTATTVPK